MKRIWRDYAEKEEIRDWQEKAQEQTFIFKFGLDFHFFNTFLYGSTF